MRDYVKAKLTWSEKEYSGDIDLVYTDKEYEVYSYELGDGIWGSTFDLCDEDAENKLIQLVGRDAYNKFCDDLQDITVKVPFSYIEAQGYSIRKGRKCVVFSKRDAEKAVFSGELRNDEGELMELDADDSPLRQLGFI